MERQKKKQNGITLIALVISIIVMLILAGVSLNMTIGDNGIISQAQNATIQSGMAALQEYLQQEYVKNYEKFEDDESKVVRLQNLYPTYFYIPSNEGIGSLRYIVDSNGHALYLIKKSGLPNEIQKQLVGGEAGEKTYQDYATLNDVYGVTSDLTVYYSEGNGAEILGVSTDELDNDNPTRIVFSSTGSSSPMAALLSSYDMDGDGNISAEEIKSVKTLTIDSNSNITSLSDLYNLTSLQQLTIEGKRLLSLEGIQNCTNLYYLYLKGCTISDYTDLCELGRKLQYLYLYNIDDTELSTLCDDISKADFEKLEYFAVVGNDSYISSTLEYVDGGKSDKTITTLMPLSKLSIKTKKAIKYLSLQCNNIADSLTVSNTDYIKDFTNIYLLRLEYNKLYTLSGLVNMTNLRYLYGCENLLGTGCKEDGTDPTKDCISSLANKVKNNSNGTVTGLYYVNLKNNVNLKYVDYFKNDIAIRYLHLGGCNSGMTVNSIASIINNCGTNYTLPCKFLNGAIYKLSDYYTASTATYSQIYSDLYGNTTIQGVWLDNNKVLSNSELNTILTSMSNLRFVNASNTNLSNLSFLTGKSKGKFKGLILSNTQVTDLTVLKDCGSNLQYLQVNNENSNFTGLDNYISNISSYSINGSNYIGLNIGSQKCLNNLVSQINPTSITLSPKVGTVDLTNWTRLTYIGFRGNGSTTLKMNFLNNGKYWLENCGSISVNQLGTNVDLQFYSPICNDNGWKTFWGSLDGKSGWINTLELHRPEYLKFNYNFSKGGVEIRNINYTSYTSSIKTDFTYFNGIKNLTSFTDPEGSGVTIEDLKSHTTLTSLTCNYDEIGSLDGIESLINLQYLNLKENNIASLKPLEKLINLKTLNLQNNCIYDTSSYTVTDVEGNKTTSTYNNLEILARLNKNYTLSENEIKAGYKKGNLENIYISGNSGIVDYSPISKLSWGEKNGF